MIWILSIVAILCILLASMVSPIIALVLAAKKRVLVFYDISDALLSVLFFVIVTLMLILSVLVPFRNNMSDILDIFSSRYDFFTSFESFFLYIGVIILIASLFYHLYVALLYNRPRRFAVFISFIGRYFITALILVAPISIYLLFRAIFGFGQSIYYALANISLLAFVVVYIFMMSLLIYKLKISELTDYVDFSRMKAIGDDVSQEIEAAKIARNLPHKTNSEE